MKMTASKYFGNISVQISPNDKKVDILKFYTERAVEKCLRWKSAKPKWGVFSETPCMNIIPKHTMPVQHPIMYIFTALLKETK